MMYPLNSCFEAQLHEHLQCVPLMRHMIIIPIVLVLLRVIFRGWGVSGELPKPYQALTSSSSLQFCARMRARLTQSCSHHVCVGPKCVPRMGFPVIRDCPHIRVYRVLSCVSLNSETWPNLVPAAQHLRPCQGSGRPHPRGTGCRCSLC